MLGRNIHGGGVSWSTDTIRRIATDCGGVPDYELAVIADNGDCVVWDTDGSVRTAIKAESVVLEVA